MKKPSKLKYISFVIISVVYLFTVLYLTVIRGDFRYDEPRLNLVPIVDLIEVFNTAGVGTFIWLFVGNIIWFIPFGFLLTIILKKKNLLIIAASGFAFSLVVETIQYFSRKGVAELDDLLLNTLGAIIGGLAYKLMFSRKSYQKGNAEHDL